MKKIVKFFLIPLMGLLAILFMWKGRSTEKKGYEQAIRPPIPKMDIPFTVYDFDADSGIVINRPTGTVIKIPANAFIDSTGNMIRGKIHLNVREFHEANDIFRAGIPMSTDSSRNNYLQSAGMIELRAYSNGKQIELGNNKNAEIALAGFRNAEGYRLYHFEKDKNWNVTDTFYTGKNIPKIKSIDSLKTIVRSGEKEDIIFELITNYEEVPYLNAFRDLKWKISKTDVNEKVIEAMRSTWDEVKVKPIPISKKKFKLEFKRRMYNGDEKDIIKTFQVNAYPIKDGKNINASEIKSVMKNYDEVMAQVSDEMERLNKQADLLNSFKINKMGIWNCDKLYNRSEFVTKEVEFDFEKNDDPIKRKINVYALYTEDNSVIEYPSERPRHIGFVKGKSMELNLVLPGGKLVKINEKEIEKKLLSNSEKITFNTTITKY